MYAISDKFKAALVKSHVVVSKAEVYGPTGSYLASLELIDGQVTVDDVELRRRYNLAIVDENYVPDTTFGADPNASLLNPELGNEIKLYRGIDFRDGTAPEYVPLGVFSIDDVQLDDSGQGLHIRVEGFDRSKKLSDAAMANTYNIANGTNVKTALQNLALFRYPDITFSAAWVAYTTTATLPSTTLITGDNPWNKIVKLGLEALGADIYFDVNGDLTIVPVADPSLGGATVWTYMEGSEATFLYINKRVTTQDSPNHIIVFGEHPDNTAPIRGEAFDSNPASPTYYLGPYGDRVKTYEGQAVKDATQATAWATAILNKTLGVSELVRFNAIVNPAHEVGDMIGIDRSRSKVSSIYVIDKLTIPLVAQRVMEVATRRRKI